MHNLQGVHKVKNKIVFAVESRLMEELVHRTNQDSTEQSRTVERERERERRGGQTPTAGLKEKKKKRETWTNNRCGEE